MRDTSKAPGSLGGSPGPSEGPPGGPQTQQREPLSESPHSRCKICLTFPWVPFGGLPTLFVASPVPVRIPSKDRAKLDPPIPTSVVHGVFCLLLEKPAAILRMDLTWATQGVCLVAQAIPIITMPKQDEKLTFLALHFIPSALLEASSCFSTRLAILVIAFSNLFNSRSSFLVISGSLFNRSPLVDVRV